LLKVLLRFQLVTQYKSGPNVPAVRPDTTASGVLYRADAALSSIYYLDCRSVPFVRHELH